MPWIDPPMSRFLLVNPLAGLRGTAQKAQNEADRAWHALPRHQGECSSSSLDVNESQGTLRRRLRPGLYSTLSTDFVEGSLGRTFQVGRHLIKHATVGLGSQRILQCLAAAPVLKANHLARILDTDCAITTQEPRLLQQAQVVIEDATDRLRGLG